MVENPFIITEKIIPEYFCDRKTESAQLIDLIKNGNNVVLISPRRVGKTGLIQFCFDQPPLSNDYLLVYIDILSTTNLQEFTFLLGREVFDKIKGKGAALWQSFLAIVKSLSGKIGFDPISGLPTLNIQLGDIAYPEFTLKEIFQYLSSSKKKCVVAIDEFQQINRYPEKNVEALIRSHLLQINNCRMIFSGSEQHILSEMFGYHSRPFYQSAAIMEIGVIPESIYTDFIVDMFARRKKRISYELAGKIYRMFDGITFNIQRVCNSVFGNTGVDEEANEDTLRFSLDGILSSYDGIYRRRLSSLTTRQKELLIAIAREGVAKKITSVEFIRRYSLASASAVQTALKALLNSDLVIKSEEGYLVEDRFLRPWLNRNY